MTVALIVAAAFLCVQLGVALVNAATFPRLRDTGRHPDRGRVSLLVPARDEAETLPGTLPGYLAQGALEVLVLDDGSTDATPDLLAAAAADAPTLRVLRGAPLPSGWTGKAWACHQLAEAAHGDLLLFTDADVTWSPGALDALLAARERRDAGLATAWPRQRVVGWLERLLVPQVDVILLGGLPYPWVGRLPFASLAAANGQAMLWTRAGYGAAGGHGAVRGAVLDDVRMAQRAKAAGVRLELALGGDLLSTRMYRRPGDVIEGFAKNVRAAAGSAAALAALQAASLLAYVAPWLLAPFDPRWWPVACLGPALRALVAGVVGRSPLEGVLQPLAPLAALPVVVRSLRRGGGYVWRGRTYRRSDAP